MAASVDTQGQQHRRSGIIAATCPAVRVRIIGSNPIPGVGIADAKPTEAASQTSNRDGPAVTIPSHYAVCTTASPAGRSNKRRDTTDSGAMLKARTATAMSINASVIATGPTSPMASETANEAGI